MKISLVSKKRKAKTSKKGFVTTSKNTDPVSLEIREFQNAISRNQLVAVVIEQQTSKKYNFRAHTLDHPHGIVLVTRRNKRKPRAFKTIDKTVEVFTALTGVNVFTQTAEIYGGIIVIPFMTEKEVLNVGPKK